MPFDPYVAMLKRVYLLQEAGFPFDPDDFPVSFWEDLGLLRLKLKAKWSGCPLGASG